MKIIKDDFAKYLSPINNPFDAICITTNKIVKNNGELVMGAGIAKLAKKAYPALPKIWGKRIKEIDESINIMCTKISGVEGVDLDQAPYLLSFCTKNDWKDKSSLKLIENSTIELYYLILHMNWKNVLLPKPGCSNGGLNWEKDVFPTINPYLNIFGDRITIISKD